MDWQALFNVVLAVAFFALGGLCKVLWDTMATLRSDLQRLATSVSNTTGSLPETYVRRDDFKEHTSRVLTVLDRIEQKLDGKVDKP